MIRKSFDQFLIDSGIITQDQRNSCAQEARIGSAAFNHCLTRKYKIAETVLAQEYARFMKIPFLEVITEKMADATLLAKVPFSFLRDNAVMPLSLDSGNVIATAHPLVFQPVDEISMLLGESFSLVVAPEQTIIEAINRFYPVEESKQMIEELEEEATAETVDFEIGDQKDILASAAEAPIIKLANHIFVQAVKRDASDIHIEPFEKELRVRYRIDGIMHTVMSPPKRVQNALISRIKIMAHMDIAEKRIPQDGRIQIKVADRAIDIRVSILPVAFGERVVMRLLDKSRSFAKLDELGLHESDYQKVKLAIARPNGIIYITGPTGSGKTTTLYSILAVLNGPDVNIITVEDPVEYQMAGIGQVQVREKIGMTFAVALRSILRQDPDIVMIGETRDQETAQISIQAALTGHLVLSTLHTNNAPSAITRLVDMGIEPFLIASTVALVIAQRLVRSLCPLCKQPYTPTREMLARFGLTEQEARKITFYHAKGCHECLESGYKGRIPIFEVMEMSDTVVRATLERADATTIRKQAIAGGMTLLMEDGLRKVKQGLTTLEEVISAATMEQQGAVLE